MFHLGTTPETRAALVVLSLLLLCFVSRLLSKSWSDDRHYKRAKGLLTQSKHWYTMALQDKNPLFALRHLNYAVAYVEAARHIAPDDVLAQLTEINVRDLRQRIDAQTDAVSRKLSKTCPRLRTSGSHMSSWVP